MAGACDKAAALSVSDDGAAKVGLSGAVHGWSWTCDMQTDGHVSTAGPTDHHRTLKSDDMVAVKVFFFFSRVDIFFGYILLSCDARGWLLIAVCVLFHSQLHPVISVSQKLHCDVFVFRALKLLCSAQVKSRTLPQSVKYFWKGQGCKDWYYSSSWTLMTDASHFCG